MSQPLTSIAIDDDPLMLHHYEMILHDIPWIALIETYASPVKAASGIIRIKPDVIFLDINMPHVEGMALIDWVLPKMRQLDYQPDIIIVSADTELDTYRHSMIRGKLDKSLFTGEHSIEETLRKLLVK